MNDSLEARSMHDLLKQRGELMAMLSAKAGNDGGPSGGGGQARYPEFIESFEQTTKMEQEVEEEEVEEEEVEEEDEEEGASSLLSTKLQDDDRGLPPTAKRCKTELELEDGGCQSELHFASVDRKRCWPNDLDPCSLTTYGTSPFSSGGRLPRPASAVDDQAEAAAAQETACPRDKRAASYPAPATATDNCDRSPEALNQSLSFGGGSSFDFKQGITALQELDDILTTATNVDQGVTAASVSAPDHRRCSEVDGDDLDGSNEEIDKLLEEGLQKEQNADDKTAEGGDEQRACDGGASGAAALVDDGEVPRPAHVREKIVLRNRGTEYFEVLPDGWIDVTHNSGIPVYLHKETRVCTLSRPYFIGPGSVRNHDVPLASIPCLHQKRMKEVEEQQQRQRQRAGAEQHLGHGTGATGTSSPTDVDDIKTKLAMKFKMPEVKVQTTQDYAARNLKPDQLHEYTRKLFEFEKIKVMRFKSWSEHRAFHKRLKQEKQLESAGVNPVVAAAVDHDGRCPTTRAAGTSAPAAAAAGSRPTLPSNVKLITVPDLEKGCKPQHKQFYMNPQGKTSIAILHEYVQKVLKSLISYEFSETRNAANPYCATVKLMMVGRNRTDVAGGQEESSLCTIGTGFGNSKKNAKLEAAKQALHVLIPGIEFNEDGVAEVTPRDDVVELFDLIQITDSRVHELSSKAGQPTPFVILQECLKRNSALGNTTINMKIERIKHQQHEFILSVGKHEVRVYCSNKKEGKQKAAQAMLERLHPQIKTWGSLIRLYGYGAQRRLQETRKEKDSIIRLQSQSKRQPNEPNTAILGKLRSEMKKLYDKYRKGESATNAANVSTVIVKGIDI